MDLNVEDAVRYASGLYHEAQYEEAEKLFRAAATVDPNNQYAAQGTGLCLMELDRPKEALSFFDKSFEIMRNDLIALSANRARALADVGRPSEALVAFQSLLRQDPTNPHLLLNRGLVLLQLRNYTGAINDMNLVLEREPENDKAKFGRGFANLLLGNYEEGFADYEHRLKGYLEPIDAPEWTGNQDLSGKTILVHEDQGLGDNIMFMRYVELLKEKAAHVVVVISDNVKPLVPADVEVVSADRSTWPAFDYWVRFMSLAYCFRTTRQTVPAPAPVTFDVEKLRRWRDKIGVGGALKVGLCWTGSPHSKYDSHRSIPLEKLAPLFDVRGVKFFSLQKEVRPEDLAAFNRFPMANLAVGFEDYADTACAMECLDLVITVDTSVAHMAGTVGVPTWVMLTDYRTYWVWVDGEKDCPWYASARVFRQKVDGDWDSVVFQIRDRLTSLTQPRALTG